VAGQDGDAFAGADAQAGQAMGQSAGLGVDLRESPGSFRRVEGQRLGLSRGLFAQHVRDARWVHPWVSSWREGASGGLAGVPGRCARSSRPVTESSAGRSRVCADYA
jgi:hypothetical protein